MTVTSLQKVCLKFPFYSFFLVTTGISLRLSWFPLLFPPAALPSLWLLVTGNGGERL